MKSLKLLSCFTLLLSLLMVSCQMDTMDNAKMEVHSKPVPKKAPVPPVSYHQMEENDPLMNTEEYAYIEENTFRDATKYPLSTFSTDVDQASYSNVRRFINSGNMPPKDAVRIEELVNYFDYDYPEPTDEHPFTVNTEISACPWNADHRLVHIGLQGKTVSKAKMPPSNLVFLVDVSGSMDQPNKLPLLKNSLKMLTKEIRDNDRIAIVAYAGASGVVLPSTEGKDRRGIRMALDQLRAGGSTAGASGIKLAYQIAQRNFIKEGNNRVILATDGDFNVGVSSTSDLVRLIEKKRGEGVFLSVLGFGTGNYKDAKMEQLADNGNGNYAYIDNINEAKKVLVNEMTSTLFTIAKDVKLQLEFNPAHVKEYRLIGYENRLLKDEEFNDDLKDAGDIGAGHTVTAMYEIIPAGSKESMTASVDELKYQKKPSVKSSAKKDPDLVTIKLRYKAPDATVSKKFETTAKDTGLDLKSTSDNFRFAASVASYGMLLRDSNFKGNATFESTEQLASTALGNDEFGYRAEFLTLLQQCQRIDTNASAEK